MHSENYKAQQPDNLIIIYQQIIGEVTIKQKLSYLRSIPDRKLNGFFQSFYFFVQISQSHQLFRILWNIYNQIMLLLVLLVFLVKIVNTQNQLFSMNRCLGNCAFCSNNELSRCSGLELESCVKGYNGTNCLPRPIYANEVLLMDSQKNNPLPSMWSSRNMSLCWYNNSKQQKIQVNTLGFYTKTQENLIRVQVFQNYQNFILSFNLIRGSWTPFSDSLRVTVSDQNLNSITENFIEFQTRSQINPEVNVLRCKNNSARMIEKYQIQGLLNKGHTQLVISFEGDMFSGADWALTNVKILFGCSKFLYLERGECQRCEQGYYLTRQGGKIIGCEPCPFNCSICSSNQSCTSCIFGFTLQNGKCLNNNYILPLAVPNRSIVCQNSQVFRQSISSNIEQKLDLNFSSLPDHSKVRLIFYLAYSPSAVSLFENIIIKIDGKDALQITGQSLPKQQNKSSESCKNIFGKGFYSLHKIVTNYIEHKNTTLNLVVTSTKSIKIGISEVGFQFDSIPRNNSNNTNNTSSSNNGSNTSSNSISNNNSLTNNSNTTNGNTNRSNTTANTNTTNNINGTGNTNNTNSTQNTNTTPSIGNITINPNRTNTSNTSVNNTNSNSSSNFWGINNSTNNNSLQNNSNQTSDVQPDKSSENNNNASKDNGGQNISNKSGDNSFVNSTNTSLVVDEESKKIEQMIKTIKEIKGQIVFGVKRDKQLSISIQYPIQILTNIFLSIKFENQEFSIIPQIAKISNQFHQLKIPLSKSIQNQTLAIFVHNYEPLPTSASHQSNPMPIRSLFTVSQAKPIKQKIGQVLITRFDYLPQVQQEIYQKYSMFYIVLSWIVIIGTICFAAFGQAALLKDFSILLQILFLHLYIYSQYLPINFKIILGGLQRMENLNYFISSHSSVIQSWILGSEIQKSPPQFTIYNKDINFSRSMYPSVIILLVYLVIFILSSVCKKKMEESLAIIDENDQHTFCQKIKLFMIRCCERVLNYWYQIWEYQYIVFIWSICMQLNNLNYSINSNRSEILNGIFCFFVLIAVVSLPVGVVIYLEKKYFKLDYFEYTYWYQNIFLFKLPQQSLPSNQHRIQLILNSFRYIILAISFSLLLNFPIAAISLVLLSHLFHIVYLKVTHVQVKPTLEVIQVIQYVLLIVLSILMLVAYGISFSVSSQSYLILGHIMATVCLITVISGLTKCTMLMYWKARDKIHQKQLSEFRPAIGTERIV